VLEAANSRNLEVVTGALNTATKNLGSASAEAYLDLDEFRGLHWHNCTDYFKEAILFATSVLPSE